MSANKIAPSGNGLVLVAFCCANSSAKAAELSKAPFKVDGVNVRLAQLACSSKIQVVHVLQALETGADAVVLWTCPAESCRFGRGCLRAAKRIERARRILQQIGLGSERVFYQALDPKDTDALDSALKDITEQLAKLGQSPLKNVGVK
jgi:F420-non-reducing hydrogenase iron-sulfur subunit